MRAFYNPDLARAVALLHHLADGISANELREMGPAYAEAAIIISPTFETIGLRVCKKIAKFDLVVELAGGMVRLDRANGRQA